MPLLSSLAQGDHVCAVYDDPQDQVQHLAQYIRLGIEAGERCLYIVDDRSTEDVKDALQAGGVDVQGATADHRLLLLTKRESYLQRGVFDPDAMIWALSAMTDQAVADGCAGLRITGEMTWALGDETGCERLIEYETKLNQFFPDSRAHAICQYNRARFSPGIIRDVLRTHPLALVGGQLSPNPYYQPPNFVPVPGLPQPSVDQMLAELGRNCPECGQQGTFDIETVVKGNQAASGGTCRHCGFSYSPL